MCVQTRPFIVGHAVETLIYSSASVFHFTSTLEAFAMHSHGYCNWRGSRSLLLYIHHSPGWCCNKLTINSNLPMPRQAGAMMTTRCALGDLMHACTWAWCVHCKAWSSLCPSPPNTIWSLLSFRAFQTPGGVNWWQPVVTKMMRTYDSVTKNCHVQHRRWWRNPFPPTSKGGYQTLRSVTLFSFHPTGMWQRERALFWLNDWLTELFLIWIGFYFPLPTVDSLLTPYKTKTLKHTTGNAFPPFYVCLCCAFERPFFTMIRSIVNRSTT